MNNSHIVTSTKSEAHLRQIRLYDRYRQKVSEMTNETVKVLTQEGDEDVMQGNKFDKEWKLVPKLNKEVHITKNSQQLCEMIICFEL